MTALSDLLVKSNADGWSTREIARRAEKNEHTLAQPTVSKYMSGRHGRPTEAVLAAFSDVFNIPIDKLREAAGVPTGADSPWTPPSEANRLDLRQRRALEELIRSMVTSEAIGEDQEDDDHELHATLEHHEGSGKSRAVADQAQPDGIKQPDPVKSARIKAQRAKWDRHRKAAFNDRATDTSTGGHGAGPNVHPLEGGNSSAGERPWEQDEYGLAAKRGRNRGREAREQQDRDAGDGGT